jgi:hypothetical protein
LTPPEIASMFHLCASASSWRVGEEMLTDGQRYWMAVMLPLLICIAVKDADIVGWEGWGRRPYESFPQAFKLLEYLFYPFELGGFLLMFATIPLLSLLNFLGFDFDLALHCLPYALFSLYFLVWYRERTDEITLMDSLIGAIIISFWALFVRIGLKGSSDGQAAIALIAGINGSFVAAVFLAEASRLVRSRLI